MGMNMYTYGVYSEQVIASILTYEGDNSALETIGLLAQGAKVSFKGAYIFQVKGGYMLTDKTTYDRVAKAFNL
jgi:hypothetical protein